MSRKPDLWMPFFIADYLADTAHLSTEQHGAYILMLLAAWRRGGSLPNDPAQLAAITRLPAARWRQHASILLAFFAVADDTIVQGRLAAEYAEAVRANDAQKANGAKGGRPRKETQKKPTGFDRLNPNESPSPTPLQARNETTVDTPPAAAVSDRIGQFEGHEHPETAPNPVAPFAIALNRLGFRCTSLSPDLVAFHAAGGTVAHLTECAALPDCTGKPAAYVIRIARRELTERAPAITGALRHERTPARSEGLADRAAKRLAGIIERNGPLAGTG